MVGGYQIIDLNDLTEESEGSYISNRIYSFDKPVRIQLHGLNGIYCFDTWTETSWSKDPVSGTEQKELVGSITSGESTYSIRLYLYNALVDSVGLTLAIES